MMDIGVTKGQVLRYTLLPQVLPRFRDLISSGFSHLAYFMALVYRATNILPDNHPYLNSHAVGKYSILDVLSQASNHLDFNVKNIDKIVIFFALIAGLFILAIQFFLLLLAIFISPAQAQSFPTGIGEFFITKAPKEDLALRMLDSVFGVPEIFGSKELDGGTSAFHDALHALFQIYSFGLLVIAVIILIYFIFAILAETAQTGTPFGKRYNHVWAPIRLVVGVGMLVPVMLGLNAGQWLTLYAAEMGSGFATTGWNIFNETLGNETYLRKEELVSTPKVPELRDLSAFMMMVHACKRAYDTKSNIRDIDAWIINDQDGGQSTDLLSTSYIDAIEFSNGEDIYIRFGQKSDEYTESTAGVYPHCGDIVIQNPAPVDSSANGLAFSSVNASNILNLRYYELVVRMWGRDFHGMQEGAYIYMDRRMLDIHAADPPRELKGTIVTEATEFIEERIPQAVQEAQDEFEPDGAGAEFLKFGWGGAALWYNKIADVNGKLTTAALNKPQVKRYPAAMTYTCEENQQQNSTTSPKTCFDPNLSKGKQVQYSSKHSENVASALSDLFNYWYENDDDLTGNAFIDVINAILGTESLFNMCANSDIHPLAQLSTLGKGMIEAAIRNLGISLGTGAAGILAGFFGPTLDAASSFFATVASVGILIGFILFYIVPFLPFLYFLFAVGGWVKGIFEAMVGVPLWALAHLRIDGEGLPGDAAINGYFLIFEIFVRPLLIIFGLIASIVIFGAMVKVLNNTWGLIISNVSGFDPDTAAAANCQTPGVPNPSQPGTIEWMRGPIDELFFTVIYAIVVYMTGMSSFKLIDMIPNNILRWMGQGIQTFNDQRGEPAEGLLSKVAIGGSMVGSNLQIAGNLKEVGGNLAKGAMNLAGAKK